MAHWTDIKVSALGSRVSWTPARNNERTNDAMCWFKLAISSAFECTWMYRIVSCLHSTSELIVWPSFHHNCDETVRHLSNELAIHCHRCLCGYHLSVFSIFPFAMDHYLSIFSSIIFEFWTSFGVCLWLPLGSIAPLHSLYIFRLIFFVLGMWPWHYHYCHHLHVDSRDHTISAYYTVIIVNILGLCLTFTQFVTTHSCNHCHLNTV